MIVIEDILFSDDIRDKKFVCDLHACKGRCCVEGESGAPLEKDELSILEQVFPEIKPYLTPEGLAAIEAKGVWLEEKDDEYTGFATPLIGDTGACAYVNVDEKGIYYCTIEKVFLEGKIHWQKPVSCHLYPVRIKEYEGFTAINYDEWDICDPACKLGESLKVPVYKFVKTALIRKFGEEVYEALEATIEHMDKEET